MALDMKLVALLSVLALSMGVQAADAQLTKTCPASICCSFPTTPEETEKYCKCWSNNLCPFLCPIVDVCPPPPTTCPASLCCGFPDLSEVEEYCKCWKNDLCPFKCPIFDVCPPTKTCPADLCCGFPDKSEVEDYCKCWKNDLCPFKCPIFDVC